MIKRYKILNGNKEQRGIALIVALLVVALATVLIAGLLDRGELAAARTRNVLRAEQAQAYALGMEVYAASVLRKDLFDHVDSNSDIWGVPLAPVPVPGGIISAKMRDLNGCFNLNNLVGADEGNWRDRFKRLLRALKLDPTLLPAVIDWIDADVGISNGGAEDMNYLAQPLPYRAANRPFAHVSELRLVRGVSDEVYARLVPQVCALPVGVLATKININTATIPVLMTIDDAIDETMARKLWSEGHAHFNDAQESTVQAALNNPLIRVDQRAYSVESTFFLARGDIALDGLTFTFYSVLSRPSSGVIQVIARSRGSD
jgi:general secretion pathway protein K